MNLTWLSLGMLVCLGSALTATAAAKKPYPVILLTDCGADMDDQWLLAHLALSPEFDLRGVVTSHAFFLPKPEAELPSACLR